MLDFMDNPIGLAPTLFPHKGTDWITSLINNPYNYKPQVELPN